MRLFQKVSRWLFEKFHFIADTSVVSHSEFYPSPSQTRTPHFIRTDSCILYNTDEGFAVTMMIRFL